ncbi:Nramp family divalent metal transporter [Phenylobacterium sp. LjRoot219]|uniref:Nramp family divalent metal transporter n=1 Tax=Phenylobacterium sp. LjRoot219 TaxID=3342283 RepID=UPI003ECFE616
MPDTFLSDTRDEGRSGLGRWRQAELPEPPPTKGFQLLGVIGPGVILLGAALGSGEWLLGPATFVKYGLALLWVTGVAVFFQTVFNMELVRYTLYTGEPAVVGFMRTRPHAGFWAVFYALMYLLQSGWPAWAGAAAGAIFFLATGNLAGDGQVEQVYWIGVGVYLLCVAILLVGRRIERTLELLNWVMVAVILCGLLLLCLLVAPPSKWIGAVVGFAGYDWDRGHFALLPPGADWFLIGAFAAYSGTGGVGNLSLSNWSRDKGFGMGRVVGYIPAAVGGHEVALAPTGCVFPPTADNMQRWRGWWRIVRVDQWGVFFCGALLGMALPAILYTSVIASGEDIRGPGIAAKLAQSLGGGSWLALMVAFMGAWMLFKTQLNSLEGMVRAVTDILWTGSGRVRRWSNGDVRWVYYGVLGLFVVWALVALGLAQPIILLQLGANIAGFVMVVASLHILYVNTTMLPLELRPPLWRRAALVAMALFYGFFVALWLFG